MTARNTITMFLIASLIGAHFAVAGYDDGIEKGAALTVAQKSAITQAIAQIEAMANSDASTKNKKTLKRIAKCLRLMLKNKQICRETIAKPDFKAITLLDDKCTWKGDKMNIVPGCLTKNEPGFSTLIAVLVHEGVHTLQWKGGPVAGDSEAGQEWVAYSWEKYILKRRKAEENLTAAQKKAIDKRLVSACKWRDHYCKCFETEKKKKGDNAKGGRAKKSLATANQEYTSTFPASGLIEVWDTSTFDVIATLDTGFDAATDMWVFLDTNNADVLYVGGTDDTLTQGGVVAFFDNNLDGIPETRIDITNALALPRSFAVDDALTRLYVLDLNADDHNRIMTIEDTDFDGLPDALLPIPFADFNAFPQIDEAWKIFTESTGELVLSPRRNGMDFVEGEIVYHFLVDDDKNGVADTVMSVPEIELLNPTTPVFMRDVLVGDGTIQVQASPGSLIQVWITDENGGELELIAQTVVGDPSWVSTINLDRAITNVDQFIKVKDANDPNLEMEGPDAVLPSDTPEIFEIDLLEVLPGDEVQLLGRNFTADATVSLSDIPAIVVSASANEIIFRAPAIDQLPPGFVVVEVSTLAENPSGIVGLLVHGDCNKNGVADVLDICEDPAIDQNGNGIPDSCEVQIPSVSEWGLMVMTLLALTAGTIVFGRRRRVAAA